MIAVILFVLSSSLVLGAKQQCAFPGQLVVPCRCYHQQLSCRGKQVTDKVLNAVFHNLSTHLPAYSRHIESFELIDSNVKSISPKVNLAIAVSLRV